MRLITIRVDVKNKYFDIKRIQDDQEVYLRLPFHPVLQSYVASIFNKEDIVFFKKMISDEPLSENRISDFDRKCWAGS